MWLFVREDEATSGHISNWASPSEMISLCLAFMLPQPSTRGPTYSKKPCWWCRRSSQVGTTGVFWWHFWWGLKLLVLLLFLIFHFEDPSEGAVKINKLMNDKCICSFKAGYRDSVWDSHSETGSLHYKCPRSQTCTWFLSLPVNPRLRGWSGTFTETPGALAAPLCQHCGKTFRHKT